jgi:hypothetical protein
MSLSEKHHSTSAQSSRDSRHSILQRTLTFFYQKKKNYALDQQYAALSPPQKHKYIFENTALLGVWIFTVVMFVSTSLIECSYPSRRLEFGAFWISKGVSMKELICLTI